MTNRETTSLATIEAVCEHASDLLYDHTVYHEFRRRKQAVALLMSSLVLSSLFFPELAPAAHSSAPKVEYAQPLQEVGVFEPLLLSRNLQQSEQVAQLAKAHGFNSVEIRENYVQWEAGNVENDWQAYCNAAQAAQENNLHLYVTFQTYYSQGQPGSEINGGRGFMPTSLTDYKKFNTTMITYLNGLSGPPANPLINRLHRCPGLKAPMTNDEINLGNEPNDPHFVTQQYDSQGNYLNPQEEVNLYNYEYPRLKAEAKKLGVNLTIAIGALNPNINNIDFINAMGAAIKAGNIHQRIADEWDGHMYTPGGTPLTVHPNAADIGPADIPMLSSALDNAFGYKLQIIGGESGVQTYVPSDERNLYEQVQNDQPTTDETGQGQYHSQLLGVMACTPRVRGVYNMHLIDDFSGRPWALSGFYYPPANSSNTLNSSSNPIQYTNLTPKSDISVIENDNLAAENGTIPCPSN